MSSKSNVLSEVTKSGKRGSSLESALYSAFDNENEKAHKENNVGKKQK